MMGKVSIAAHFEYTHILVSTYTDHHVMGRRISGIENRPKVRTHFSTICGDKITNFFLSTTHFGRTFFAHLRQYVCRYFHGCYFFV
jgi:hypothetical protein